MAGSDFVLGIVAIRLALLVATGLLLQALPARSHHRPDDILAMSAVLATPPSAAVASVQNEDATLHDLKLHD